MQVDTVHPSKCKHSALDASGARAAGSQSEVATKVGAKWAAAASANRQLSKPLVLPPAATTEPASLLKETYPLPECLSAVVRALLGGLECSLISGHTGSLVYAPTTLRPLCTVCPC